MSVTRLLVLYDGSTVSDRALDDALRSIKEGGGEITLLAALPARLWRAKQGQFPTSLDAHDEEFGLAQLAKGAARCRESGIEPATVLRSGALLEILSEESAKGFDALVLGERRSPSARPSLSSLVRPVAACDVIAVP